MTTRRQFIQAGAAVGAAAAPGASALAAAIPAVPAPLSFHKVAFDGRLAASLAFAGEARRLGAEVHDTGGDVTGLYADHLLDRWRRAPEPVAGMTLYGSMFVLKMMAETAGLRLVYRAHHLADGEGGVSHQVFGPDAMHAQALFGAAGSGWSRRAAQVVMALPANDVALAKGRSNIAEADRTAIARDTLVSWVLAPLRRG